MFDVLTLLEKAAVPLVSVATANTRIVDFFILNGSLLWQHIASGLILGHPEFIVWSEVSLWRFVAPRETDLIAGD
jgi:hypothetical protein